MYPLNKNLPLITEEGSLSEAGHALVLELCAENTPESLQQLSTLYYLSLVVAANFRTHRTLEDVRKSDAGESPLTNRGPIDNGKP